jgi:hypothetical protein
MWNGAGTRVMLLACFLSTRKVAQPQVNLSKIMIDTRLQMKDSCFTMRNQSPLCRQLDDPLWIFINLPLESSTRHVVRVEEFFEGQIEN